MFPDLDKFVTLYRNNLSKSMVERLLLLKSQGASQMDCAKVLLHVDKMSIPDADEVVMSSGLWDIGPTIRLREDFADVLHMLSENPELIDNPELLDDSERER